MSVLVESTRQNRVQPLVSHLSVGVAGWRVIIEGLNEICGCLSQSDRLPIALNRPEYVLRLGRRARVPSHSI